MKFILPLLVVGFMTNFFGSFAYSEERIVSSWQQNFFVKILEPCSPAKRGGDQVTRELHPGTALRYTEESRPTMISTGKIQMCGVRQTSNSKDLVYHLYDREISGTQEAVWEYVGGERKAIEKAGRGAQKRCQENIKSFLLNHPRVKSCDENGTQAIRKKSQ